MTKRFTETGLYTVDGEAIVKTHLGNMPESQAHKLADGTAKDIMTGTSIYGLIVIALWILGILLKG